jgi:hypothetical protein
MLPSRPTTAKMTRLLNIILRAWYRHYQATGSLVYEKKESDKLGPPRDHPKLN